MEGDESGASVETHDAEHVEKKEEQDFSTVENRRDWAIERFKAMFNAEQENKEEVDRIQQTLFELRTQQAVVDEKIAMVTQQLAAIREKLRTSSRDAEGSREEERQALSELAQRQEEKINIESSLNRAKSALKDANLAHADAKDKAEKASWFACGAGTAIVGTKAIGGTAAWLGTTAATEAAGSTLLGLELTTAATAAGTTATTVAGYCVAATGVGLVAVGGAYIAKTAYDSNKAHDLERGKFEAIGRAKEVELRKDGELSLSQQCEQAATARKNSATAKKEQLEKTLVEGEAEERASLAHQRQKQQEKAEVSQKLADLQRSLEDAKMKWQESQKELDNCQNELAQMEEEFRQHADPQTYQFGKDKTVQRMIESLKSGKHDVLNSLKKNPKASCAVLGNRGAGKSSTINALVGVEVAKTGATDTTLLYNKVCETELAEFYDVPGETPERSLVNLEALQTVKQMRVVLLIYVDEIANIFVLAQCACALGTEVIVVRNKTEDLNVDCDCTPDSKACIECVKEHDQSKLESFCQERGLPSLPLHFIVSKPGVTRGIESLKQTLGSKGVDPSGKVWDWRTAVSFAPDLDEKWLVQFKQLWEECHLADYPDVLTVGVGNGLSTTHRRSIEEQASVWIGDRVQKGGALEVAQQQVPLHLYTLESPSVYKQMSLVLNEPSRTLASPSVTAAVVWSKWVTTAMHSLDASYNFQGECFREVTFTYSDELWRDKFEPGQIFPWYVLKSVTPSLDAIVSLSPASGPLTVFVLRNCKGKRIQEFSAYQTECEVLLPPGSMFRVVGAVRASHSNDARAPFDRADTVTLEMMGHNVFFD